MNWAALILLTNFYAIVGCERSSAQDLPRRQQQQAENQTEKEIRHDRCDVHDDAMRNASAAARAAIIAPTANDLTFNLKWKKSLKCSILYRPHFSKRIASISPKFLLLVAPRFGGAFLRLGLLPGLPPGRCFALALATTPASARNNMSWDCGEQRAQMNSGALANHVHEHQHERGALTMAT
jgi:hypothetical protein